ncbi:VPS72 Vacuolar protein sorting-associated protein 72 [Candida maltosa Xu316]
MSDDESDGIFESLIATRARRSNAGSRLKQLIELEEQSNELTQTNQFVTEDDENVDLLFQEDGDDEEFIDEEVDNANLNGIDEDDDEEEDEDNESLPKKRQHNVDDEEEGEDGNVNPDEVLSDSDLSSSDTDESEGEKELMKQERLKKKRVKKQRLIPTIKQVQPEKKKQKRTHLITADSLLLSSRRSSSRSAALESKQALVDKLKESEARRAKYVHVERKKHVELTQEERLAEAVETEKANIESLNRFEEQENVKKEKQRQLLLSKRVKLHNVIRMVSKETFVNPIEEVTDARRQYEKYLALRKRLGKKKKQQLDESYFPRKMPFTIDYDSPYQKALLAEKKKLEQEEEIKKLETMNVKLKEILETRDADDIKTEDDPVKTEDVETDEIKTEINGDNEESIIIDGTDENMVEDGEKETPNGDIKSEESGDNGVKTTDLETEKEVIQETKEEINGEVNNGEVNNVEPIKDEQENGNGPVLKEDGETEQTKTEEPIKPVKFADEVVSSREETPAIEPINETKDEEIFEGPPQRVSRNMIYLIDFDEEKKDFRFDNPSNIKKILFGKQSLLPGSRRFKDVKTILTIGKVENPYAITKEDKDSLFEPATELNEDDPMFDILKKLPRIGVKQDLIEEVEDKEEEKSTEIVIKTEAPTGLYLPNGNKKNCMFSGTEVKYFDPSTGIPYSSVDAYKILKAIEQGQVPWLSFTGENNDSGNVELYLGSRDGSTRHAKGVPDGFDG